MTTSQQGAAEQSQPQKPTITASLQQSDTGKKKFACTTCSRETHRSNLRPLPPCHSCRCCCPFPLSCLFSLVFNSYQRTFPPFITPLSPCDSNSPKCKSFIPEVLLGCCMSGWNEPANPFESFTGKLQWTGRMTEHYSTVMEERATH